MADTPEERDRVKKMAEKETKARLKASGVADLPVYSDITTQEILSTPDTPAAVPGGYGTNAPSPTAFDPSDVNNFGDSARVAAELEANSAEGPKQSMPRMVEEEPDGTLGKVMDFADRIWYDHMGDLLRGKAGFTEDLGPAYRYTLGAMAEVGLSLGSELIDAMYWGSKQADSVLALGYSALPGGMDTLDWSWNGFKSVEDNGGFQGEVTEISPGRAGIAALASPIAAFADGDAKKVRNLGSFASALTPILGPQALVISGASLFDAENPIFTEEGQKNLLDEDVQERVFEDNKLLGLVGAGSADFFWDIFGDPTIVGGKATSVLRYGTKMGNFAGLSNQSLANPKQVKKFADRIDQGLDAQAAGVRAPTAEFEHVKTLVDNEPAALVDHVFVKNSNDPQAVIRLATSIEPGDYQSGAALVKALAGERSGWVQLSETAPGIYDDLYRTVTGGADLFDDAARGAAMSPIQVTQGRKMVAEAQKALDEVNLQYLPDELVGKARDPYVAGQILTRGGGRNAAMARGADAWRLGKSRGRWAAPIVDEVGQVASYAGKTGWVAQRIRATSQSRPVVMLRWAGNGRPTNIVHLKGGDGVNAGTEIRAWLQHSSLTSTQRNTFFNSYMRETTVEGRRNLLLAMERAEVAAVAAKLNMPADAAMEAYKSYASVRNKKVWEVRKTAQEMQEKKSGTAFTIDEQGQQVHVAGLYSELDEAFPLLDTLEFGRVVKANRGGLIAKTKNYGLARGTEVGDFLNNMWKVSVLLRLGYTARNITEGALRSAAVIGTMAANPQALARVPRSLSYRAARRLAHRKNGSITVKTQAVDAALNDMYEARRTLLKFREEAAIEEVATAERALRDLDDLIRAAESASTKRIPVPTRDEFVDDLRLPVDDEIDDITKGLDELKKEFEIAEIKLAGGSGTKKQLGEIQKKINRETGKLETRLTRRETARDKAYAKRLKERDKQEVDRAKELQKLRDRRAKQQAKLEEMQIKKSAAMPQVNAQTRLLTAKMNNVEARIAELKRAQNALERWKPKRARVGESKNVYTQADGTQVEFEGAFMGSDGDIARLLASADNTYQQVFNTGYTTRASQMKMASEWKTFDPAEIRTPEGWTEYWDQYTLMLNRRMRNDPLVRRWLSRGDDESGLLDDSVKWMLREDQKSYVGTLRTQDGKRLVDDSGNVIKSQVETYVNEIYYRYRTEIPKGTGLRSALYEAQLTPQQAREAFGGRRPPVIASPVERGEAGIGRAVDKIQTFTGWAMKWLGTIPENQLLRHPFYDAVFRAEQMRLARLAADQGADLLSNATKAQINAGARKVALKETRKTMYTIERQTNASNVLRFVMPFFPAWENALRTWGRITYQNPAVLGAGALLWNIPNSLGWVVDAEGNKVENSNFLSESDETYVVYPESVANALAKLNKDIGPLNTAAMLPFVGNFLPPADENGNAITSRTRQQGLNVVFPGGLLDPGIGPFQTIPTSLLLRGKPEVTEILRQAMGDDMFNNFVPLGNPNTPIPDQFLPTLVKRTKNYVFGGEDENTAYLRLQNTMIQDEIVRAELEGRRVNKRDMERVLKNADKFYRWSIQTAATGFTASVSYQSEFAVERGYWRQLQEQDLPYSEKVDRFVAKFGTEFLAVTRSTSKNAFKLGYTQHAYDRVTSDPGRVEDIAETYGEKYVGQFANIGDIYSPFSYSVYGEFAGLRIDDDRVLEKMTPEEIVESNDIAEYWRNRAIAKDELDMYAASIGLPGADSLDDYDEIMDVIEADLREKYPGIERELSKGYDAQQVDKTIQVSREIVDTAAQYGDDDNPTIIVLGEYLARRDFYVEALKQVPDDADAKKDIKKLAMADVAQLRLKDIGFADYYDRYLEDDDFREVS